MPFLHAHRRPLLLALAITFGAATACYGVIWMYYIRRMPPAGIGIAFRAYKDGDTGLSIHRVFPETPAESAGLRPGDLIVAVNGQRLRSFRPFFDQVLRGRPGETVRLSVERSDSTAREITFTVPPQPSGMIVRTPAQATALNIIGFYPFLFLVVGFVVLLLRSDDRNAWLLALLFACFIAAPDLGTPDAEPLIHPSLRGFTLGFRNVFGILSPAVFYFLFAVFPVASPLERRAPWLKWLFLAFGATTLPVALRVFAAGSREPLLDFDLWVNRHFSVQPVAAGYALLGFGLGLVSLVWNRLAAPAAEARRKLSVIVWGTVGGLLPMLLLVVAGIALGRNPFFEFPLLIWASTIAALFLIPLSFAYAVVKHRVLEIPVLLKRSVRYLLVRRGFEVATLAETALVAWLFVSVISRLSQQWQQIALPGGISAGIAFGLALAWVNTRIQEKVTQRIDRAFFRSAYDARKIFQELTEKTRIVHSREELAALLGRHVSEALHPQSLAIYLEGTDGRLRAESGGPPATLDPSLPVLQAVAQHGEPWEPPLGSKAPADFHALAPLEPECVAPMLARDGRLVGLMVLGQRLSEEPYSREDKQLLASVAGQAALAIESIRLAEKMAERIEAERRARYEMELAKSVQARLFPQRQPVLRTLEYSGRCIQARAVGGDYYDFLDFGSGRAGLVLADVSGKGMAAALLMANLQASLRSQYAVALEGLPRLLKSANGSLYESTASEHYCTLFFGDYQDSARLLRYANCGHNPPVLLRAGGRVERLDSTATVLGAFANWECAIDEVELEPGDLLVAFTDGVTEARRESDEEEFGEGRLIDALRANTASPVSVLLDNLVAAVERFSSGEQADDLTLVVARAV